MEESTKKLNSELLILKSKIFRQKLYSSVIIIFILAEIIVVSLFVTKYILGDSFNLSNFLNINKNNKVAVLDINKMITTDYVNKIMNKLDTLKEDKSIKEILIKINSGGGSPSASDDLSYYLKDYQKEKPITMYVESMAASGAYYIASSVKPLYANKNAIVGSIGVLMPHFVLKGLSEKLGIEQDNISVGKYKEPLSLFEKANDNQKDYLKEYLLNEVYDNFINVISENRNIDYDIIKQYADGKIYTASLSNIKGILVDKIVTIVDIKRDLKNKYTDVKFVNVSLENKVNSLFNIQLNIKDLPQTFLNKFNIQLH